LLAVKLQQMQEKAAEAAAAPAAAAAAAPSSSPSTDVLQQQLADARASCARALRDSDRYQKVSTSHPSPSCVMRDV
jgi:hypothetical protein